MAAGRTSRAEPSSMTQPARSTGSVPVFTSSTHSKAASRPDWGGSLRVSEKRRVAGPGVAAPATSDWRGVVGGGAPPDTGIRVGAGEGPGMLAVVALGKGVGVSAGGSAATKSASSKQAVEAPAGQSMRRMRAERAASGARTGAVARTVQAAEVVSALSCWAMLVPLPSADSYQLMRMDAAASPSTRASTAAAYQAPPLPVTAWWSHFVGAVSESRQAA